MRRLSVFAACNSVFQDDYEPFEVGDLGADATHVLRGDGFDTAARAGAILRTEIKKRAHLSERESEFSGAMNEP